MINEIVFYDIHRINKNVDNLTIEGHFIMEKYEVYDQKKINILHTWQEGNNVIWNSSSDYHTKYSYFDALSILNNWWNMEFVKVKGEVDFDQYDIIDTYDFFYYLGYVLKGNKGFMGYRYECLEYIYYYLNKHNIEYNLDVKIHFTNLHTVFKDKIELNDIIRLLKTVWIVISE